MNDERAREINEGAGRKDREHIETDGLPDPEERSPALERLGILLELAKADGSVSLGAQFHYDDRFRTPGWPHGSYALLLTDLEEAVEGCKDLTTRIRGALAVIKEHGWGDAPDQQAWVIDQVLRALAADGYRHLLEIAWDGPGNQPWNTGTAPHPEGG